MKTKFFSSVLFASLLAASYTHAISTNQENNDSTKTQNISSNTNQEKTQFHHNSQNKVKGNIGKKYMMELKKNNPEEFNRLMQLRKTDPNKFRSELRKNIQSSMQKSQQGKHHRQNNQCRELVKQYKNAQTPEEKEKIKAELKNKLEESFTNKQKEREQLTQKLKERLDKLQKSLDNQNSQKEQLIDQQLDKLLTQKNNKRKE